MNAKLYKQQQITQMFCTEGIILYIYETSKWKSQRNGLNTFKAGLLPRQTQFFYLTAAFHTSVPVLQISDFSQCDKNYSAPHTCFCKQAELPLFRFTMAIISFIFCILGEL